MVPSHVPMPDWALHLYPSHILLQRPFPFPLMVNIFHCASLAPLPPSSSHLHSVKPQFALGETPLSLNYVS